MLLVGELIRTCGSFRLLTMEEARFENSGEHVVTFLVSEYQRICFE